MAEQSKLAMSEPTFPKVNSIGRMLDNERALLVMLAAKPSDDELRALHDALRSHADLIAALKASKPYVVRCIENDPEAPWMRGLPIEPAEALIRRINAVLEKVGAR